MERVLRIDMGAPGGPRAAAAPLGPHAGLGGRGLAAALVAAEVDPACDPLAGDNALVFAPGLLAGAGAPEAGRLWVGCKSPLTGGLGVASAGGEAGLTLARLGLAAVVITGRPPVGTLVTLRLDAAGASFAPAARLRMAGNRRTLAALAREHGAAAARLAIGPAGELRLAGASIAAADDRGLPSRHMGGGGVGAVMGAKGLKAVVVDGSGAPPAAPRDPDRLLAALAGFRAALAAAGPGVAPAVQGAGTRLALGAHCGVTDARRVAALARQADDLGLDALELAVTLGVAVTAGLARAGDGPALLGLVREVGRGTPVGRVVGSGAALAARVLGLPAPLRAAAPATRAAGRRSRAGKASAGGGLAEVATAAIDCTGMGLLDVLPVLERPEALASLLHLLGAHDGAARSLADLLDLGEAALSAERSFDARAGLGPEAHLPRFFERPPAAAAPVAARGHADPEVRG